MNRPRALLALVSLLLLLLAAGCSRHLFQQIPESQQQTLYLYLFIGIGLLATALGAVAFLAVRFRRAQSEADQARQQATLANRAKNDFLATLSHELRTPMIGVLGMADALAQSPLNDSQRESVETMRRSSESLLALIDDLLDFAKLDAGRLRIDAKPFDLWTGLEEAVLLSESQAREKNLELAMSFAANLPRIVVGDSRRLRQIVINLVSNAVKFTNTGSVKVTAEVAAWNGPEARVRVAVTDTGIGIDPAKHGLLFRRFSQVDTSTTRTRGGTGLGLAIVKELVTAMEGSVGVDSASGRGSTFWFELPYPTSTAQDVFKPRVSELICASPTAARQAARLIAAWDLTPAVAVREDPAASDALSAPVRPSVAWRRIHEGPAPKPDAEPSGLRGRILLVEDNEVSQRVASALLKRLGLEVSVARNGAECLDQWEPYRFDAILMDCTMPVMDGYEATRRIRERERPAAAPRIPIIALTATVIEEARRECLEAGMDDFVSKPVKRETLEPLLAQWLPRGKAASPK